MGGERFLSPGPTGIVGFATTTGRPFASQKQGILLGQQLRAAVWADRIAQLNLNIFIDRPGRAGLGENALGARVQHAIWRRQPVPRPAR